MLIGGHQREVPRLRIYRPAPAIGERGRSSASQKHRDTEERWRAASLNMQIEPWVQLWTLCNCRLSAKRLLNTRHVDRERLKTGQWQQKRPREAV